MGTARTATVAAKDYCELYSLSRSDLEAVMMRFPELAVEFNILTGEGGDECSWPIRTHSRCRKSTDS
jgi:hypothetical protein